MYLCCVIANFHLSLYIWMRSYGLWVCVLFSLLQIGAYVCVCMHDLFALDYGNRVVVDHTSVALFGNDIILFENDMYPFGKVIFLFGRHVSLVGDYMFLFGDDMFLSGTEMFLFRNDIFLFGNGMYLIGRPWLAMAGHGRP